VAGHLCIVDLSVSAFVSLFFLSLFSFGLGCVAAPASLLYQVVAILI
jgi:hypothetical protein